ncbi:MAG: hypothetical protein JWM21_2744 [Acidobacteria bacterium]|nr:hypothetical protein [Acidobacteriota bacterium]
MAVKNSGEKRQQKVGIPAKRRGQQMGFAGQPDQNRERASDTPALRGRLKSANKMFGDPSSQEIGTSPASARSNSPSVGAMNTGGHPGETTGERVFKRARKTRRKVSS